MFRLVYLKSRWSVQYYRISSKMYILWKAANVMTEPVNAMSISIARFDCIAYFEVLSFQFVVYHLLWVIPREIYHLNFFLRLIFFSFFVEKYFIRIFLFQYDMHNFREIYFWKLLSSIYYSKTINFSIVKFLKYIMECVRNINVLKKGKN